MFASPGVFSLLLSLLLPHLVSLPSGLTLLALCLSRLSFCLLQIIEDFALLLFGEFMFLYFVFVFNCHFVSLDRV